MTHKTKVVLTRLGKTAAAGGIAWAIQHLPELGGIVPDSELTLPIIASLLLAAEKAIRYKP